MAPQPGDIGLVCIAGGVGWLIRIAQWANGDGFRDYEHAFVYVGGGQIVEAEPGGARLADLAEYDGRPVAWIPCPDRHRPLVAAAARGLEGTPYSVLDYVALAAHRLHIPVPGLKAYIQSTHHAICSQLCDIAAARGGWHLFDDGRWAGYVTPADLAALAS